MAQPFDINSGFETSFEQTRETTVGLLQWDTCKRRCQQLADLSLSSQWSSPHVVSFVLISMLYSLLSNMAEVMSCHFWNEVLQDVADSGLVTLSLSHKTLSVESQSACHEKSM